MGIFINLAISKSVTKDEWEKVYEETLVLVDNLPLAESVKKEIHGIDVYCLEKTREHDEPGYLQAGWEANGDYEYMKTSEGYFLPRDLVGNHEVEIDAGDAMLNVKLPNYIEGENRYETGERIYNIWGNKTQGRPYHIYLLAVACLIEARLGNKAYIYGDITLDQCRKAVDLANLYLVNPIEMPSMCSADKLSKRISKMPIENDIKEKLFNSVCLGKNRDLTEVFNLLMGVKSNSIKDEYKINDEWDLLLFANGDTMNTDLIWRVRDIRNQLDSMSLGEEYYSLMQNNAHTRCEWIEKNNNYYLIRDKDWEKIFNEVENDDDSFVRYYKIMYMRIDSLDLVNICKALLINDDLYSYSNEEVF